MSQAQAIAARRAIPAAPKSQCAETLGNAPGEWRRSCITFSDAEGLEGGTWLERDGLARDIDWVQIHGIAARASVWLRSEPVPASMKVEEGVMEDAGTGSNLR